MAYFSVLTFYDNRQSNRPETKNIGWLQALYVALFSRTVN